MNRISEDVIEKIRNTIDIVDVVSEYVQLKKQGRNYFGLCPFHGENSPSFSVSTEKQIYHCFGCGAGGNVFSFLMEIEGLSFLESVKLAAKRTNVELPDTLETHQTTNQSSRASKMIEAHELLKKFYHHLLVNTKEGEKPLEYLINRGITRETIDTFGIGYSPSSWDFATKFLQKRGFSLELLEHAGITIRNHEGKHFDRFRNRVMFPLWDLQGQVTAFSGRIIDSGEPKYLNSPETEIFHKGKNLYGFHLAKSHIRKKQQAILLEGFMDVISLHRAELPFSIATMGTALTDDQIRIIRRNVDHVTVCFDSDNAGIVAAYKASSLLRAAGCEVRVALMPEGHDPDDYIKKFGPEKFRTNVIGASLTLMAFKLQYFKRGRDLQDEADRISYIDEVLKEISALSKPVERDHYLRQLSDEFSISLDALKSQAYQQYKQQKKRDNVPSSRNNISTRPTMQSKMRPAYQNAERLLLAHMLRSQEVTEKVQQSLQGLFNIEEHSAIAAYLYAFYEDGHAPSVNAFISRVEEKELQRIISELSMLNINEDISQQELADYIKQVLNYPKLLKIKEKEQERRDAERKQEFVQAAQIQMEILQMKKELK
ncbi:DNA primase [Bacillus suaedaesalsae]|uniref:DNA primase n=1 Tax=Bacillus suaedaesalsae TaxID=2810349 RepID=A0ABS2DL97_9BACI|nr:DNA primase [Bacillus suaedaesalsae]